MMQSVTIRVANDERYSRPWNECTMLMLALLGMGLLISNIAIALSKIECAKRSRERINPTGRSVVTGMIVRTLAQPGSTCERCSYIIAIRGVWLF